MPDNQSSDVRMQQPKEQRIIIFNSDNNDRVATPLLRVDKLARLFAPTSNDKRPLWTTMTLDMCLRNGFIDMIHKEEEKDNVVAWDLKDFRTRFQAPHCVQFTHIEIMQFCVMGPEVPSCYADLLSRYHESL